MASNLESIRAISKAAAKWWADKFRAGIVSTDLVDVGASLSELQTEMYLHMQRKKSYEPCTPQEIENFERTLAERLEVQAVLSNSVVSIYVDHAPDWFLYKACKSAGITGGKLNALPLKTDMHIYFGSPEIKVVEGYHGETESVLPEPV